MVAWWEVPVRVGITPAWCNVRRVKHIGVDEFHLGAYAFVEVGVTFLNVLAPELGAFKELRALWDFAAELIDVFLEHELLEILVSMG